MILFRILALFFLLLASNSSRADYITVTSAFLSSDGMYWEPVSLGDAWSRANSPRSGVRYYKVTIPEGSLSIDENYLVIPRLGNRGEVFLNGVVVAKIGDLKDADQDFSGKPYLIPLPRLRQNDENLLVFKIAGNAARFSGLSHLYIGDKESVGHFYDINLLYTSFLYYFIALVSLFAGVIAFVFFILRRSKAAFQISMSGLLWSVSVYLWSWDDLPIGFSVWLWLMDVIYGVFLWFTCQATLNFLSIRKLSYPRLITLGCVLFCLGATYNAIYEAPRVKLASDLISVIAWCYALYNVWLQVFRRKTFSNVSIGVAGLAMLPVGLLDVYNMWLSMSYDAYARPYYTHIILLIYVVAVSIALVRQFDRALKIEDRYRKKMAKSLGRKNRELEVLYRERERAMKEAAAKEERARIVRNIHDGVGGNLVSLLNNIRSTSGLDKNVELDAIEALAQLRLAIDTIDPVEMDPILILGQIRYRMTPRLERCGIGVKWQVQPLPKSGLIDGAAAELSYIFMEVFANIIKHSQASNVFVSTSYDQFSHLFSISIRDDGKGFDMKSSRKGRGLDNMRTRAANIGMEIQFLSSVSGVSVVLSWAESLGD